MRYRLVALMLFFVLPAMYPSAAPVPEPPYAILDIGPPPKGKTAEKHCKEQIGYLTAPRGMSFEVWCDPEVQKLRLYESVRNVTGKDFDSWLEKTNRVTSENGGRHLRFTFQAGNRAEQTVVINTLLRIYVRESVTKAIQKREKILRENEEAATQVAQLIQQEKNEDIRRQWQMQRVESLDRDAQFRDDIARLKQVAVIKWAK